MKRYAQINHQGICYAIIESKGNLDGENMIKLHPHKDGDVIGKKYVNGDWEDVEESSENSLLSKEEITLPFLQFLLGKFCTYTTEEISQCFQKGIWSKEMVAEMVAKGKLSENEYSTIIGESYGKD